MHQRADKTTITRARTLRGNATDSERKLWRELRVLKQRGYHFRRQAPFRGYVLDFVEHTLRLVIEVDGGSHAAPENLARDAVRDAVLQREGYLTLRVWNDEISKDIDGVMETIHRVLKERGRLCSASAPHPEREPRSDLPTGGR